MPKDIIVLFYCIFRNQLFFYYHNTIHLIRIRKVYDKSYVNIHDYQVL